jgi:hypothetical protein
MTVKLSVTSKLDGIRSWSLNALDTCPGSVSHKGELVDACKGCYATTGNYRFSNVRAPRDHNQGDWRREAWVNDMVQALGNDRYFRWFDSGDMYSVALARKILAVMLLTPHVQHWLPTRMHKFAKFRPVLNYMRSLPNVAVRYSSDSVTGDFTPGLHGSTIIPSKDAATAGVKVCEAYEHEGKCSGCRACWDARIPVIGYVAHGKKMEKVLRLKAV